MMNYESLSHVPISSDFSEKATLLLSEPDTNFVKLVDVSGLDASVDLAGTDLSDVNFSNCDLRGYNFSRCDLRGAFGSNVIFDHTTNFLGADVEGSLFSYYIEINSFQDRTLEDQYQRLKSSYWGSICDWIGQNIKENSQERDRLMAARLFFDVKDFTVKTDILLRIKRLFKGIDEYRRFLVNIILRDGNDYRSVMAAMRVASSIVNSDRFLFKTILSYAQTTNAESSISLMSGLIYSPFFLNHVKEIREVVDQKSNYSLRVSFVRRINVVFAYCKDEYLKIDENQYIDYKKPLNFDDLKKMIKSNSDRAVNKAVGELKRQKSPPYRDKVNEKEVSYNIQLEAARNIVGSLRRFENQDLYLIDGVHSPDDLVTKI